MENVIVKTLDNRSLVLALDYLYREHMKSFEVETLLPAATELIEELSASIVNVPIEGYYNESEALKDYFLKVRTLQNCEEKLNKKVDKLRSYKLLAKTMSSEIFGSGEAGGFLPQRLDSLFYALAAVPVQEWSVEVLVSQANVISARNDDISLVGIAASINDAVVLAALRESVALYGAIADGSAMILPTIKYEWKVDGALQDKVNRFIKIFNILTSNCICEASPENIEYFYDAFEENSILGRCIYIGYDDTKIPIERYHWAIKHESNEVVVDEFWSTELWTTERYQEEKFLV